ncbi:MAG TPA: hypothetical protein VFP98_06040 [Candidatus Polarisedimenticolia bacterium]|nr:hypothetical protein [Candidatus Polarisedimenticolia bacterium]
MPRDPEGKKLGAEELEKRSAPYTLQQEPTDTPTAEPDPTGVGGGTTEPPEELHPGKGHKS